MVAVREVVDVHRDRVGERHLALVDQAQHRVGGERLGHAPDPVVQVRAHRGARGVGRTVRLEERASLRVDDADDGAGDAVRQARHRRSVDLRDLVGGELRRAADEDGAASVVSLVVSGAASVVVASASVVVARGRSGGGRGGRARTGGGVTAVTVVAPPHEAATRPTTAAIAIVAVRALRMCPPPLFRAVTTAIALRAIMSRSARSHKNPCRCVPDAPGRTMVAAIHGGDRACSRRFRGLDRARSTGSCRAHPVIRVTGPRQPVGDKDKSHQPQDPR